MKPAVSGCTRRAVDLDDLAFLDRHREAARIRTVQRTGRLHRALPPTQLVSPPHVRSVSGDSAPLWSWPSAYRDSPRSGPSRRGRYNLRGGASGCRWRRRPGVQTSVLDLARGAAPAGRDRRRRVRRALRGAGAEAPARARDAHRPAEPPPVPDAALPGGHGRTLARRHRLADPLDSPPAAKCPRAARRSPLGGHRAPDPDVRLRRGSLRRAHPRRRLDAFVLRPRRVAGACPRPQDARRCAVDSRQSAARLRARRAIAVSRDAAPPADVPDRGRRPDRGRARRRPGRDRPPLAEARVSLDRA